MTIDHVSAVGLRWRLVLILVIACSASFLGCRYFRLMHSFITFTITVKSCRVLLVINLKG